MKEGCNGKKRWRLSWERKSDSMVALLLRCQLCIVSGNVFLLERDPERAADAEKKRVRKFYLPVVV